MVWAFILICAPLSAQKGYKGGQKYVGFTMELLPIGENYPTEKPLLQPISFKLEQTVNKLLDTVNICGVTIAVLSPDGVWQYSSGFANKPNNSKVDSATVFYWASVGKLVTATVIAQLINEKKISNDSRLAQWFPQFEHAKKITIGHLLTHTSGIYSFNSDSAFSHTNTYQSPAQLLGIALANKNHFKPGQYWAYSNTGYLLLALIAEKVENKTFSQIVAERISRPLGLNSLQALEPMQQPANMALAHKNDTLVSTDYSLPLGAGNMVATSTDVAKTLYALLAGKLLPPAQVKDMMADLYPMFGSNQNYYGKGIMLYNFKAINNTNAIWIGHSGGMPNYKAIVAYDVDTRCFIAISINQNTPAEALAYALINVLREKK